MASGTHQYQQDPRNDTILININGELLPRNEAKISVFDSGFILGDGIWEGIRLHHGMLAWPAGKRDSDGVWASHWYHSVEQSSGFSEEIAKDFVLSQAQQQVVAQVSPYFEYLYAKRIRVE